MLDKILLSSLLVASSAGAELVASGQPRAMHHDAVLVIGQCVLSVQNLYKRVTPGDGEMPVIPFEDAQNDPGCPKLRDYSEVERTYANRFKRVAVNTGASFMINNTVPALGEAYEDASGLIWGEIVRSKGKIIEMTASEADSYCNSLGVRLPTREEYARLRMHLGGKNSSEGYSPKAIDLESDVLTGLSQGSFWTSSMANGNRISFVGIAGTFSTHNNFGNRELNAVRCVGS